VVIPTVGQHYHSIRITTEYCPDQIPPRIPENPRMSQITPRHLAVQPVPPGASSATQKIGKTLCIAWRPGVCRQAVPLPGTQNTRNSMSRLAMVHHPLGGFWKFQKRRIIKDLTLHKQPIYHTVTHY